MNSVRVVGGILLPGCLAASDDDERLRSEARFPEVPRNVARHLPTRTAKSNHDRPPSRS